jgi:hypothetical protein
MEYLILGLSIPIPNVIIIKLAFILMKSSWFLKDSSAWIQSIYLQHYRLLLQKSVRISKTAIDQAHYGHCLYHA